MDQRLPEPCPSEGWPYLSIYLILGCSFSCQSKDFGIHCLSGSQAAKILCVGRAVSPIPRDEHGLHDSKRNEA